MPVSYHDPAAVRPPADYSRAAYAGNAPPGSVNPTPWAPMPNPHDYPAAAQRPDDRFSYASMSNMSTSTGPLSSTAPMSQYDPTAAAIAQARVDSRSPTATSSSGSRPSANAVSEKQALAFDLYAQEAHERRVGSYTDQPGVSTAQNETREFDPSELVPAPPAYTYTVSSKS